MIGWLDNRDQQKFCGTHTVVQRLVGPWTAVPEDTE